MKLELTYYDENKEMIKTTLKRVFKNEESEKLRPNTLGFIQSAKN